MTRGGKQNKKTKRNFPQKSGQFIRVLHKKKLSFLFSSLNRPHSLVLFPPSLSLLGHNFEHTFTKPNVVLEQTQTEQGGGSVVSKGNNTLAGLGDNR